MSTNRWHCDWKPSNRNDYHLSFADRRDPVGHVPPDVDWKDLKKKNVKPVSHTEK